VHKTIDTYTTDMATRKTHTALKDGL